MTRLIAGLLIGVVLVFAAIVGIPNLLWPPEPRAIEARGKLAELEQTSVEVFDAVSPSVVQVVALRGDMRAAAQAGSGTGFVWDRAGHIVTNNHVVEGAASLAVRLANQQVVPATIVGRAPNYDLAVIRISAGFALPPPVPIGSMADLKVGQVAYAIGNPFGLDQSLTMGIISALKRRLPTAAGRELRDVIQTDAAINPGNSGGPLLDSAGRLIGVNTAIFSPSGASAGIGFAIPVDVVNRVVPELIKTGRVPTPGIGIVAAEEAIATQLGVSGVVVADVVPGSPAQRAGIRGIDVGQNRLGDVIVEANGKEINGLSDLIDLLEAVGVGQTVSLRLWSPGGSRTVDVAVIDIAR